MYSNEKIKDMIGRSISSYYCSLGYVRYTFTYDDIAAYLSNPDAIQTQAMLEDFVDVERCVKYVIEHAYDAMNSEFVGNLARFINRDQHCFLRDREININGAIFQPTISSVQELDNDMEAMMASHDPITIASEMFAYFMKRDVYTGNTVMLSLMIANKVLLHNEIGILYIPIEDRANFSNIRLEYCRGVQEMYYPLIESLNRYVYRIQPDDAKFDSSFPLVTANAFIINGRGKVAYIGDRIKIIPFDAVVDIEEISVSNNGVLVTVSGSNRKLTLADIYDFEVILSRSPYSKPDSMLGDLLNASNGMN